MQDGTDDFHRRGGEPLLQHFGFHIFQADLIQLVDGDGDVHHLVREAADLGKARQNFAVVDFYQHAHVQQGEHPVHHLHQFQFVHLRAAADDIHIALIELAVASFLRTVGPPDRLDLETLEREGYLAAMLHHIPGERNGQVIAKSLFGSQRRLFTAVLDAEEKFVTFLAILSQQGGQVFHGRRLDLRIAKGAENAFDGIENIIPFGHVLLAEVSCAFRNRRSLHTTCA